MRTYYRGPDARITDVSFVWHTSPPRRFLIPALHNVVVVQRRLGRGRPTVTPVLGGAVVIAIAARPLLGTLAGRAAALLLLLTGSIIIAALHRARPRQWEVRARHQGQDVVIFSTTDAAAFGKVSRGLRRALEASGPEDVELQPRLMIEHDPAGTVDLAR